MSFSEQTEKLVNQLINAEYKNACEKFGEKYHSLHEGYAVLKEELEEVRDEYNSLLSNYHYLWEKLKDNDKDILSTIAEMQIDVIRQMQELAQVGAVLYKIRNTIDKVKLRVARKDRENLQDAVANGLEDFIKEKPYTSLRFLANKELKEKIKIIKEKLFNLLSEYEIGNYDSNVHQFYKDVYDIHNELMELL